MLKSVLKFARLRILVTCYAIAFLGSAASGAITLKTVLTIFIITAWYIHAASSNDYADRHIDEINLKEAVDRPLVAKNISFTQLWFIHHAGGLLALALASFYGVGAFLFTFAMLILDYAYSFKPIRVSDRSILSQFLLAFAYVYFPFTLGYWSTGFVGYPWLLSFGLYLGFVGRLLLKDFRDVKGDRRHDKLTFLIRHDVKTTCITSGFFGIMSLGVLLAATGFSLGIGIVLTVSQVLALYTLKDLARTNKIPDQLIQIAHIARLANSAVIAVLAFLLCLNQPSLSELETQLIPALLGISLLATNLLKYRIENHAKPA
jgi:4-hydroxybenzoate polyprenyltransferase